MHTLEAETSRYFHGVTQIRRAAVSCAPQRLGPGAAKLLRLAFLWIGLAACSAAKVDRDSLAAHGMIDASAPVKTAVQIVIQAPPDTIWNLLTNIKDWPTWQPDISEVTIQAAPAVSVPFTWATGGMTIHSTIRLFDAGRTVGWTGRAFHIHAIHIWTLTPRPNGRVLVETRESMDGWLLDRFYTSRDLQKSDERWLRQLKQAAESQMTRCGDRR